MTVIQNETANLTEIFLLALCMWREARGEGSPGMLAVGCVIRNRRNAWGGGYWQQVTARNQFSAMTVVGDGQTVKYPSPTDYAWHNAIRLATAVFGNKVDDPTDGALYYHNPQASTSAWFDRNIVRNVAGYRRTCRLGRHDFYAPVVAL